MPPSSMRVLTGLLIGACVGVGVSAALVVATGSWLAGVLITSGLALLGAAVALALENLRRSGKS